jgi:CrcB protein
MPAERVSLRALVGALPVDPDLDGVGEQLRRRRAVPMVALGGILGSLARVGLTTAIPVAARGWPTATLTVNMLGSFALGGLLTTLHEVWPANRWARPLLGTGFCGGFTTFSTFAVEFTTRAGSGRALLAAAYVVLSVIGSVLGAAAGVLITRATARLANRHAWRRRIDHALRIADEDAA